MDGWHIDFLFFTSKVKSNISKTMTNQEFFALAVIEGNLENALNIIKAKDELFRDRGFEITIKKFLYDMYSFICLCECNNDKSDEPPALRYKVFVFFWDYNVFQ